MRFFNEDTHPDNYRKAIIEMEEEVVLNFRKKERMKKVLIGSVFFFLFFILLTFYNDRLIGSVGIILSIIIFQFSLKRMRSYNIYYCFAAYTHDVLQKELRELYAQK